MSWPTLGLFEFVIQWLLEGNLAAERPGVLATLTGPQPRFLLAGSTLLLYTGVILVNCGEECSPLRRRGSRGSDLEGEGMVTKWPAASKPTTPLSSASLTAGGICSSLFSG